MGPAVPVAGSAAAIASHHDAFARRTASTNAATRMGAAGFGKSHPVRGFMLMNW